MPRNWTTGQQNAIDAEGGTVLVSAAAGSGKTAVLVERVIQRLTDPQNPVSADAVLVATFTNAAAREMKERIAARLSEMLEQDPQNSALLRQRMLLDSAAIGTVHSFCLNLIRGNFQLLDLPADFRIGDEKELNLLKEDVARDLIEEYYLEGGKGYETLVELLSVGRDDSKVMATLFSLYNFIRSHPFYGEWLDSKLLLYDPTLQLVDTPWGKTILTYATQAVKYGISLMQKAVELTSTEEILVEKYLPGFALLLEQLHKLEMLLEEHNWDGVHRFLQRLEFDRMPSVRGMKDNPRKEQATAYRKKTKDILEALAEKQFCCSTQEFCEDITLLRPVITTLFDLTKEFDARYTQAKKQKKLIDFSDIEHYAIALLVERHEGEHRKTALAEELCAHYRYLLVDEYQDTNEAQDFIFSAISSGENLFMVGDVKQSIYRFRQAMPEIFLRKKNAFLAYDGKNYPAKIVLGNNFRSRKEVTDTVNFLFHALMSVHMGELDYTEEEELVPLAQFPPKQDCQTELHLLEYRKEEEELTGVQVEARYVAQQIRTLLDGGYTVAEKNELRPIRPKDIAILLRSVKNKGDIFLQALGEAGVNAVSQDRVSFFACREISIALSLLRAVDNPLVDIPLTAAMLSPLFGFTADDIARVRVYDRAAPLYLNCLALGQWGDAKCNAFTGMLEKLRLLAATLPVGRFICKALELTDLGGIAAAMPQAQARTSNLRLLEQYATQYEKSGYKGLGGFVRFVDRLQERGDDLPAGTASTSTANVVRIMSIHASKGLEFPVVFLCDTSKAFNKQDLRSNTLLHPQLGFAAMVRDFAGRRQHTTVPMEALRLELDRSLLSEEMRMLYVALTRAKEKLFLTSVQKDVAAKLGAMSFPIDAENRLSSYVTSNATSYADWILMAALHHPSMGEVARDCQVEVSGLLPAQSALKVVLPQNLASPAPHDQEELTFTSTPDPAMMLRLRQRADYVYPFQRATELPSKVSVTQLIQKEDAPAFAASSPSFAAKKGLNAADKGTALHQFMLFANHSKGQAGLQEELRRLEEYKFLTPMQGNSISIKAVEDFYASPLYQRMIASTKVWREFRFMGDVTVADIGDLLPELGEESVTLQGVADLLFEEEGELVVVDYKTDNVQDAKTLLERYSDQLALYGTVLKKLLDTPVKELLIYSFALGKTIAVRPSVKGPEQ